MAKFDEAMPDTYEPWAGGLPTGPAAPDTLVWVWFRLGRSSEKPKPCRRWHWHHADSPGDIIGWKRAGQEATASADGALGRQALSVQEEQNPHPPTNRKGEP